MYTQLYDNLPDEARFIRKTVFIEEQGFKEEFDETDNYAKHLVMFDNGSPVAVCRFFKKGDENDYTVGRIAVLKLCRGMGVGAKLLSAAEYEIKRLGGRRILLHAQVRAKNFYIKQGYVPYGEIDFDESCAHIWMFKKLQQV